MKHPMPTTDLKGIFSVVGRRRTKAFAYGFALTFLACTAYIVLSPSFGGTPSWLTNFLASSSSSSSADSYHSHLDSFLASADSYRSQFSSFISSLLPNSTTVSGLRSPEPTNSSASGTGSPRQSSGSSNRTKSGDADAASRNGSTTGSPTGEILGKNPATAGLISGSPPPPQGGRNETAGGPPVANETTQHAEVVPARSPPPAQVEQQQPPPASPPKVSNGGGSSSGPKWNIETMSKCNLFHGKWVRDESYPMYPPGSCTHIDESFDCSRNGRPDLSYQKLRWQPHGCYIPRLNATDMLERLRGKRLAFVGDSLNRNMWESLVCILRNAVKDKSKVFEVSGKRVFKTDTFYSFIFKDYNCTVEFFRSVFLVQEWEMVDTSGNEKETLRLDMISKSSSRYRDADVIVFNTGHWWTHEKTAKGKDYYQEGNRVYGELNVVEAFHKALNTWAKWVDANVDPRKTTVFFRGYSASHFRGGRWNSGGQCDAETEPIKNETYLARYPPKMDVLESVLRGMKAPVLYLNITRMTDYRKDAHPSTYRKPNLTEEQKKGYQDCSHWCLPGVPDSWNDLLYSLLLIRQHKPE